MLSKKCVFWSIGLTAIGVAIAVTICLVIPGSNHGNHNNENSGGNGGGSGESNVEAFSRMLVVENRGCILRGLNVKNLKDKSVYVNNGSSLGTGCQFDLYLKNSIFYNDHPESIKSNSKEYPELRIPVNYFTTSFKHSWYTLAVDFVNRKVYAMSTQKNGEAYKLFVLDMLKQHYAIVLTDLDAPTDLALDPAVGLLFVSQRSSILKASMDGSSPTTILRNSGLAPVVSIDRSSQRVYWSSQSAIESVDYAGNDRRVVVSLSSSPPTDLATVGNRIFWMTPLTATASRKVLWTCQTRGYVCDSAKDLKLEDDYEVGQIKAYDFEELYSIVNSKSNPCARNNGGCEQLCLLSNSTDYSCACELGQLLQDDRRSCAKSTDPAYLLYVQGLFFRGRSMDHLGVGDEESRFGESIHPVNVFTGPMSKAKIVHFAHDVRENLAYYVDDKDVRELSLVEIRKKPFVISSTSDSEVYLATDWVSKSIYFSMSSFDDWRRENEIRVYPYGYFSNNRYFKSLIYYNEQYRVRNIVAHPNRGYVFYILTELKANSSRLVRINSDGSGRQFFMENQRVREIGLAIDFLEDRLCWFSEDGQKLESVKFKSSIEFRTIDISMVPNPQSMTFDETYVYVSNWAGVWRLNKATGASAVQLKHVNPEARQVLSGLSYHSAAAQPLLDNHPCAVNKGGCQTFCFAVPDSQESTGLRRQCGCTDDRELQPDGRTCV